jgi:hypothetical protein
MLLLMGVAAIAIDLGAGFNERNQDQTAADNTVMAFAVDTLLLDTDDQVVTKLLSLARANLDSAFVEADWRALWRGCVDPERQSWDPGTGTPIAFSPMPEPTAWGSPGSTLDCVSRASSYVRVRIPNQEVATSFGRAIGSSEITTSAVAVALLEPFGGNGGLLPFGIDGSAASGELCLKSSGSGTAYPPCSGPSAGSFGEIDSELFGDFFGAPDCGNPGAPELAQNVALGVDHFTDVWGDVASNPEGVLPGSAHPGDGTVEAYTGVTHDQCRIQAGVLGPQVAGESFPSNMMRVGVGFSPAPIEDGLISDTIFTAGSVSAPSRLQQGANPTIDLVKRRQGANNIVYSLDNRPPWDYLTAAGASVDPACDASSYAGLANTFARVAQFSQCLTNYSGTTDIFSPEIADSPRFAFAPQYWHRPSTTGKSWQPVRQYRMVFIGGLWFNCNAAGSCDIVFYPDLANSSEMCAPNGGSNCKLLNLNQLSGWMFPNEAIPDSVRNSFPGGNSAFQPSLFR